MQHPTWQRSSRPRVSVLPPSAQGHVAPGKLLPAMCGWSAVESVYSPAIEKAVLVTYSRTHVMSLLRCRCAEHAICALATTLRLGDGFQTKTRWLVQYQILWYTLCIVLSIDDSLSDSIVFSNKFDITGFRGCHYEAGMYGHAGGF